MRYLIIITLTLFFVSSCEKDDVIDNGIPLSYFDNKMYFQLQDSDGKDLLNASTAGYYKVSDMEITNIPSSERPTTLRPKTAVYLEVFKNKDDDYFYAELGLIMPDNIGKEEYIEVETSKGKKMAWVSEPEATYTKLKIGNETKTFKAVYKTYRSDDLEMYGGNSTIVQKIWCNNELIFKISEDGSREWAAPIIEVSSK